MKRVGPELKMPNLKNVKVPSFFSDLFYDLRDRRLLPLVGLVLAAIVAVPFLLGGGGSPEPEPVPVDLGAEVDPAAKLTVVEAQPGLRDYRRRLKGRTPTNPFQQRYTGSVTPEGQLPNADTGVSTPPEESGGGGGGGVSSPPVSEIPTEPVPVEPAPESSPPPSDGGSGDVGGEPTGELKLFTFAIDVRIIRTQSKADGSKEKSEPETREEVIPPAPLPSAKSLAVTYMGISPKTEKPLFLVSDDVEAIYGEAKCISGSESCQLLEVDLDMPTTFVYEPTGARFKITVLKVEPVMKGDYEG
ncbi:MAG: hypothetical protein M3335_10835 [Actinomycetota bacterium]|nr:hypothetical protein [Actinomycetota bacterium]